MNERRLHEMRSGSRLEGCFDAIVSRQASSTQLERDRMMQEAHQPSSLLRRAGVAADAVAARLRLATLPLTRRGLRLTLSTAR